VAAKKREREGWLKKEKAAKANRAHKGKGKGLSERVRTPLTKAWVQQSELEVRMFEVSDETTTSAFRGQLSHRWSKGKHVDHRQ
jgi:hypothetical protein